MTRLSRAITLVVLCPLAASLGGVACGDPPPADAAGKKSAAKAADKADKPTDKADSDAGDDDEEPKHSVTTGVVTIAGAEVPYVATTGKLRQKDDGGDAKAEVFFVAYTRGHVGDNGQAQADPARPITFCFNGGPGASSVWLHLGMLGPKRVRLPDDASFPVPPYDVVDNPFSLLDVTDLVFVDPVGTGYSRPAEGEKTDQFYGLEEDLRSVALFVHDYTTRFGRWPSPKFVLGESYGGLRAGGLAELLHQRYKLYLNGVVLVSAVLDFGTLAFADNNDLPHVVFLPGYAAAAWRHKKLADDLLALPLAEAVAGAEEFAYGPYARALLRGVSLTDEERARVVEQTARWTGLDPDYIDAADLRVPMWRFGKELLRDRRQVVGRFDSRYVGSAVDGVGEAADYDPSDAAFEGVFTSAMNSYLSRDLDYRDDRVYETLTSVQPWNYKPFINRHVTTASRLRDAMLANPALRVFAACGYYDLATPPLGMKHSRDHAFAGADLPSRFTTEFYEAGHMMYVHEPSLVKLRQDLLRWYAEGRP